MMATQVSERPWRPEGVGVNFLWLPGLPFSTWQGGGSTEASKRRDLVRGAFEVCLAHSLQGMLDSGDFDKGSTSLKMEEEIGLSSLVHGMCSRSEFWVVMNCSRDHTVLLWGWASRLQSQTT